MDNTNVVDSMKDLGKIVEAMKASSSSLVAIVNIAVNLDKKIGDAKQIKKAAKNVQNIVSNVNIFIEQIFSAINTMTSSFPTSSLDELNRLFVDANVYQLDENGNFIMKDGEKVLKESKTTLPVLICKFADSIGKIFGSINKLGEGLDISPIGIVKAKIGFMVLGKQLQDLLAEMTNTFSGLAGNKQFEDMLELLISDPTVTSKLIETNKEAIQTGQFDSANTDKSHEWEDTITGKMGLLDAIAAMLNIFTTMASLKAPNLLLFKIELIKIKIAMGSLISAMGDIVTSGKESITKTGDIVKPLENFEIVLNTLEPVFKDVANLGSYVIGIVFGIKSLKKFRDFLAWYVRTFTSKLFMKISSEKYIEQTEKTMEGIENTMGHMIVISSMLTAMSTMLVGIAVGILSAKLLILGLKWIFEGIGEMFSKENMKETMENLNNMKDAVMKLTLSVLLLTTAVVLLGLAGEYISANLKQIMIVGLFVLLVVGIAVALGLASKYIDDGVKNLLILSGAVAIISLTAVLLVFIGQYIETNWNAILQVIAMVGALVIMMVFLGVMSKFIQKGNTAVIVLALSLIIVTAAVMVMVVAAKMLDYAAMIQMVTVIGVLAACVAGVGLAAIPIAIGASVLVLMSVSMIITSVALFLFLGVVEQVKKMNLSADEKSKQTVAAPIELFKAVIEKVNEIKLITLAKAAAKMISLMIIAASLGKMADVIQKVSAMTIPYEFDKEGKPTAYRRMTDDDFASASNNIATILTTILAAIGSDEMTKILDNLKSKSLENITKVMESTSGVESLINAIEKAATFDEKTITDGALRIKQVITAYVGVLSDLFVGQGEWTTKSVSFLGRAINLPYYQVISEALIKTEDLNKSISGMKKLNNSIEKMIPLLDNMQTIVDKGSSIDGGIENIKKIVDVQEYFSKIDATKLNRSTKSFIRFVDKANTVDTKKIKTVTEMFEKMAKFSESIKGDFNALADVLSDKLVDILKKLHGTLEDINKTGTTTATTQQTLESQTQQAASVQQEKQKQQKIDPEALKNIEDILTEMSSILKDVRENTENIGGY